jgi:hypothetical protein
MAIRGVDSTVGANRICKRFTFVQSVKIKISDLRVTLVFLHSAVSVIPRVKRFAWGNRVFGLNRVFGVSADFRVEWVTRKFVRSCNQ